jgi:hypothetical protein
MRASSWVAAQLAASQEGLNSKSEWVSEWVKLHKLTTAVFAYPNEMTTSSSSSIRH